MHTLHELGVKVFFLGSGEASFIKEFSRRENLDDKHVTLLSDPSLEVYRLAGLQRSRWSTYGLPALVGVARAKGKGYSNQESAGDDTQQGGILMMDCDGLVHFCYRNKHTADVADANEVVAIAMSLAACSIDPASGIV